MLKVRSLVAALVAVLAFGASAAVASAGTVTVCDDGCDATTINGGIAAAVAGDTVSVSAGTYDENVVVNKSVTLTGVGSPTIVGQIDGGSASVKFAAADVTVEGFTITRAGNNTTDWNNPGLTSSGVAIQGQAITGAVVQDNTITGMRTAIDVNNTNGVTIVRNNIDDNRTGLIFRNQTDDLVMTNNFITDNWTVGVLFLDASGGTNVPLQQALNANVSNNDISGNWYGQIVDRQAGGVLPAPGTTNLKDFSGNWYGTANPVITDANSTEPGYAGQIPVEFGGSATPPGGQPDIAGPASANFDVTPLLTSGTDTGADPGFQGDFSDLKVIAELAQTGSTERIQEGVNDTTAGGTTNVAAGTYDNSASTNIDKALTLAGPNAGIDPNDPGARVAEATIAVTGSTRAIQAQDPDITIDGLRFVDSATSNANVNEPLIGAGGNFGGDAPGISVVNNLFAGITRTAVYFNGPTQMDGGTVAFNRVDHPTRPATGCGTAGTIAPSGCGHQLFNLWQTSNLAFSDNTVVADAGNLDRVRVFNATAAAGASNVDITDNTIENSCVFTCFAIGQGVTDVTVTGNNVDIDAGNAFQLHSTWSTGTVDVNHNVFNDPNDFAIVIDNASADLSNVSFNRNSLTGGAFRNGDPSTVDTQTANGECNWYGSIEGPAGLQVSGPVDTTPFLGSDDLDGPCPGPTAELSTTSLDFGNQQVGVPSAPMPVVVENVGGGTLDVSAATLGGTNPGQFYLGDGCDGKALANGETCTVNVRFRPTSGGSKTAQLSIPNSGPGSPATVSLSGTSVSGPAILVAPTDLRFGHHLIGTDSDAKTIAVRNRGNSTLSVESVTLGGTDQGDFSVVTDECTGQSLSRNERCDIEVMFSPSARGGRDADLTIVSNAPASPSVVALSGTGDKPAELTITPDTNDFGTLTVGNDTKPKVFVVQNTGDLRLDISTVALAGTDPSQFEITSDTCSGKNLQRNGKCAVRVRFAPTAGGEFSADLSIASNDAASPTTASVTGAGRLVTAKPSKVKFGDRWVGSLSGPVNITIKNHADGNVVLGAVSLSGPDGDQFVVPEDRNACSGQTLAPGATCVLQVRFHPTSAGAKVTTLSIADDAPGPEDTVEVTGTGVDA
jgi:nitrous oxidase accessory protein NosD